MTSSPDEPNAVPYFNSLPTWGFRKNGFVFKPTNWIVALLALLSACASFQERATLATGVCGDRGIEISDAADDYWIAHCDNRGSYHCHATSAEDEDDWVECEWNAVCGNDERSNSGSATVPR